MEHYRVRIAQDDLVFSAGHFLAFAGDTCERLHGHNYRVAAEVAGPLDENHFVVDFLALRAALKAIVADLDHRMLLPSEHPEIHVASDGREVTVTFGDRRWVFPRGDCVLLPLPNTTAELLARYLALRLRDALDTQMGARPSQIRIDVEECFGQSAVCEIRRED